MHSDWEQLVYITNKSMQQMTTLLLFTFTLVTWFMLVTENNCPLTYYIVHMLKTGTHVKLHTK